MKTTILNQLNIIRTREQKKLLDRALDILKTDKKISHTRSSDNLIKDLAILAAEIDLDHNYEKSLANYNKLANLLLRLINKNKRITAQLDNITQELNRFGELKEKSTGSSPAENLRDTSGGNSYDQVYTGLDASVQAIKTDLQELTQKINSYLPELSDSRPLAPFGFLNEEVQITKGMISLIILNENGSEHLKNLFDSFLKFNSYNNYQFILVDRASTDNSLEIARSYQDKLPLAIFPYDQKFTNAYLYNIAVDACKSEYILFLNNRSIFKADILPLFHDVF